MMEREIPFQQGRVALIHDWITGYRGGEKVLEAIAELYPQAELFTLFHKKDSSHPKIERLPIHASWMNRIPGVHAHYPWLLPLFPGWADALDLRGFDLVLSTSHCVAKSVRARGGAVHLCYAHTPMRYVWDRFEDYFGDSRGLKRKVLEWEAQRLRDWDRRTAPRVDQYLANSNFVRRRILDFYREAPDRVEVLYPPVEIDRFSPPPADAIRGPNYLVVSALVPYKKVDVAVAAVAASGRTMTVAGKGPEMDRLKSIVAQHGAEDRVHFLGYASGEDLPALYHQHRALLFPGVEDFGITPVEAIACGLPVIAQAEGGALDTVVDGLGGLLYEGTDAAALIMALDRFEERSEPWNSMRMHEFAGRFAKERFVSGFVDALQRAVARGPRPRDRYGRPSGA